MVVVAVVVAYQLRPPFFLLLSVSGECTKKQDIECVSEIITCYYFFTPTFLIIRSGRLDEEEEEKRWEQVFLW